MHAMAMPTRAHVVIAICRIDSGSSSPGMTLLDSRHLPICVAVFLSIAALFANAALKSRISWRVGFERQDRALTPD